MTEPGPNQYRCIPNYCDSKGGQQGSLVEKKSIHLKYSVGGEYLPGPMNKWFLKHIKPETSLDVKITHLKLS